MSSTIKVYIGDPCYVLGDEYEDFSSAALEGDTIVPLNGSNCYVHSTAWGDGIYDLLDTRRDVPSVFDAVAQLWVDSGMLSMIPMSSLSFEGQQRAESSGTYIAELPPEAEFSYESGTFRFGPYVCHTDT